MVWADWVGVFCVYNVVCCAIEGLAFSKVPVPCVDWGGLSVIGVVINLY